MKQLSLGLDKDLGGPAMCLSEEIENKVIAQLAEAIKTVHNKAEEVRDEQPLEQ